MKHHQQQIIIDFAKRTSAWIDQGCPQAPNTSKGLGLCALFRFHLTAIGANRDDQETTIKGLRSILHAYNPQAPRLYPFNTSGAHYEQECRTETCYANDKRVAFIKGLAKFELRDDLDKFIDHQEWN